MGEGQGKFEPIPNDNIKVVFEGKKTEISPDSLFELVEDFRRKFGFIDIRAWDKTRGISGINRTHTVENPVQISSALISLFPEDRYIGDEILKNANLEGKKILCVGGIEMLPLCLLNASITIVEPTFNDKKIRDILEAIPNVVLKPNELDTNDSFKDPFNLIFSSRLLSTSSGLSIPPTIFLEKLNDLLEPNGEQIHYGDELPMRFSGFAGIQDFSSNRNVFRPLGSEKVGVYRKVWSRD